MTERKSASPAVKITVDPPDTPANFLGYNIQCSSLDSDYLMQPINEAEYDSETQVCVDRQSGKHRSFYEHYRPKVGLKKGLHIGPETPLPRPLPNSDFLAPPVARDLPLTAAPKSVLRDAVTRRLASGAWPKE